MTDADIRAWAQRAGLDMARFEADWSSASVAAQVERDMAEAERIGVDGTPTFFLNGRRLAKPLT